MFEVLKFNHDGMWFKADDWVFIACETMSTGTPGKLKCVIASVQLGVSTKTVLFVVLTLSELHLVECFAHREE